MNIHRRLSSQFSKVDNFWKLEAAFLVCEYSSALGTAHKGTVFVASESILFP